MLFLIPPGDKGSEREEVGFLLSSLESELGLGLCHVPVATVTPPVVWGGAKFCGARQSLPPGSCVWLHTHTPHTHIYIGSHIFSAKHV